MAFDNKRRKRKDNTSDSFHATTLDISSRLRNVLTRNGVIDLLQITKYTKEDILRFRNMGVGTYKELEMLCNAYNIKIWTRELMIEAFRPYRFSPEVYNNMFQKNIISVQDFAGMSLEDIEEIAEKKKHTVQKICKVLEINKIAIK